MAHIQDRWEKTVEGRRVRTTRYGKGKRWQARYRDPDGQERTRDFARKADAERFLATITADVLRDAYVDPDAGKVTFADFAGQWLEAQTFTEATREATELRIRLHAVPHLGRRGAASHQAVGHPSLAPGAPAEAGADMRPRHPHQRLVGVRRRRHRRPPRPVLGAVAVVVAGCGLRQGEAFGLRVCDLDFLLQRLRVEQQVKLVRGRLIMGKPKGGRTRSVPLADPTAVELAEHLRRYPAQGEALVFTSREHKALNRNSFNRHIWRPALLAAGIEPGRGNGMHVLRHFYASVLIDAGEQANAVVEYLGHADPGFTLRVYAHLFPASEDRARAAIAAVLGPARPEDAQDAAARTTEPARMPRGGQGGPR